MYLFLRILGALALLAFAVFCLFGLAATGEPSDSPRWPWQIGYAVLGLLAFTGALRLFRQARRP